MPKGVYDRGPAEERFERWVDRTGDCHLWTGALSSIGYANFWHNGKYIGAHVFAWSLANRPLRKGEVIRHSCRNRSCVNPAHLDVGTKGDNNRDRKRDGTQAYGSAHHSSVLTERDVVVANRLHILGVSWAAIGERLGKSPGTLSDAVRHRKGIWSHVKTKYSDIS